jgi:hypothetical protein
MLIYGNPDILMPPETPTLAFGGLGYVDSVTPRTQYTGAPTDWDIFRSNLFFGDLGNRTADGHPANIQGSYYDPARWGGNVPGHQRDLIAHWKRVMSMVPGSNWYDIALAYQVPLSTIEAFARSANGYAFPIVRAVWQNPYIPDTIKRPALGLIVQRLGLSPWEWSGVVGLDEATAAEVVNVPVPKIARTSLSGVVPAVQATATAPGYVVETRTGEVAVIPAGSEPFTDAAFSNDASGRRRLVLTYSTPSGVELYFIDPNAAPLDRPIMPSKLARLRDLLGMVQRLVGERQRNITSSETQNLDLYLNQAAALIDELGFTETELALAMGLSLDEFRAAYVFDAAGFGINETRQVVELPTALPALVGPTEQVLEPVAKVFYFQFPADFADYSAEQKARFYLAMLAQGFTDAQIRITAESTFGYQPDDSWAYLQSIAASLVAADAAAAAALAAAAAEAAALAAPTSSAAAVTQQAAQVAQDAADTAAQAVTVQEAQDAAQTATTAAQTATAAASTVTTTATTGAPAVLTLPENIASLTPGQKAFLYLSLLFDAKLRDSQIRTAVEAKLGPQSDESWSALQKLAFGDFTGDRAAISGFIRYNVMKGTPLSELRKQISDMNRRDITDAEWSQFVASDVFKMPFVFGGKGAIATATGAGAAAVAAAAAAFFLLG